MEEELIKYRALGEKKQKYELPDGEVVKIDSES